MSIEDIIYSGKLKQQTKEEIKSKVQDALLSEDCSFDDMSDAFSGYMLQKYMDIDLFSKCIDKLTKDRSYENLLDSIVTMTRNLYKDNCSDEINIYILSLVINANGFKRDLGRHLWDELNLVESAIDLLEMPEEVQGRFALSILQDYKNPNSRVPKLMTLFNSEFKSARTLVYRALTNTTMNYVMNYFGTVKKQFKEANVKITEESKMFEKYLESLDKRFEIAYNCKELYTEYAMPDVYELCNKVVQEHMKEQVKEAEKNREDSFLKIAKKVILGKGGGWRKQNGTAQSLAHFKFSTEYPSMINALSYTEQINILEYQFLDWNSITKNEEKIN